MTFLNPTFLFGLLAATIPVIIHFFNLRKLKKIEFSSLLFLKELQKSKIKNLKIKQWALLLLRVLIIFFLFLAFARPTIRLVNFNNSSSKTTAIFLIDDSFSMSANEGNGSAINIGKEVVKKIIKQLSPNDEVAILTFSNITKLNLIGSSNKNKITEAIEKIKVTELSGSFGNGFSEAIEMLKQSENYNKELYILSDFYGASFGKVDSLLKKNSSKLEKSVSIYSFKIKPEVLSNISISNLKVENKIIERNKNIKFSASVKSNSPKKISSVASLYINGKRKAQQHILCNANKIETVSFDTYFTENSLSEIFVELEDDQIVADNKTFTALYLPEKINLLMIANNLEDTFFITTALNNFYSQSEINIDIKKASLINSINIEDYDICLLIGANERDINIIKEKILGRINTIIFPSNTTKTKEYKAILNILNIKHNIDVSLQELEQTPINFDTYNILHPIFTNIFENRKNIKLNSPNIYKFFKIKNLGSPIINLEDGSSFLAELNSAGKKILLFNTAPVLNWSDFPIKSIFSPLINKSLLYLSSKISEKKNYLTGENIFFNIKTNDFGSLKIVEPNNNMVIINRASKEQNKVVRYKEAYSKGIYKLYSENKLLDYAIVNIDEEETNFKIDYEETLQKYFKEFKKISYKDNFVENIKRYRFGTELWKIFIAVVFILLIIEMIISRSSKKEFKKID